MVKAFANSRQCASMSFFSFCAHRQWDGFCIQIRFGIASGHVIYVYFQLHKLQKVVMQRTTTAQLCRHLYIVSQL